MTTQSPENNKTKPEAQSATIETQAETFRNKAIKSRYVALGYLIGSFAAGSTSYYGVHKSVTGPVAEVFNNPVGSAAAFIAAISSFHKVIASLTDAGIHSGTSSELRAQIEVNDLVQKPTVAPNPTNNPLELEI